MHRSCSYMHLKYEVAIVPTARCTYPELLFWQSLVTPTICIVSDTEISFSAEEHKARLSGDFTLKEGELRH